MKQKDNKKAIRSSLALKKLNKLPNDGSRCWQYKQSELEDFCRCLPLALVKTWCTFLVRQFKLANKQTNNHDREQTRWFRRNFKAARVHAIKKHFAVFWLAAAARKSAVFLRLLIKAARACVSFRINTRCSISAPTTNGRVPGLNGSKFNDNKTNA